MQTTDNEENIKAFLSKQFVICVLLAESDLVMLHILNFWTSLFGVLWGEKQLYSCFPPGGGGTLLYSRFSVKKSYYGGKLLYNTGKLKMFQDEGYWILMVNSFPGRAIVQISEETISLFYLRFIKQNSRVFFYIKEMHNIRKNICRPKMSRIEFWSGRKNIQLIWFYW